VLNQVPCYEDILCITKQDAMKKNGGVFKRFGLDSKEELL